MNAYITYGGYTLLELMLVGLVVRNIIECDDDDDTTVACFSKRYKFIITTFDVIKNNNLFGLFIRNIMRFLSFFGFLRGKMLK